MKNANIIFASLFFIFSAKIILAQTTQEEFNYVTKGYKVQIESGLDMKKGYHFADITQARTITPNLFGKQIRDCDFKGLYRNNDNKLCAILCIYTNEWFKSTDYFCIPSFNSSQDIWDQYYNQFNKFAPDDEKAMVLGLAKLASYYAK